MKMLALAGRDRRAERGVLICGNGVGASVAARYSAAERHARRPVKVVALESRYR